MLYVNMNLFVVIVSEREQRFMFWQPSRLPKPKLSSGKIPLDGVHDDDDLEKITARNDCNDLITPMSSQSLR